MSWFGIFRIPAQLRRIAKAIEKNNDLAEFRMDLEHPEWIRMRRRKEKVGERPRTPKVASFGTMDVEAINEQYREAHPED